MEFSSASQLGDPAEADHSTLSSSASVPVTALRLDLKVDFAASEIWVNLQGSMCHYHDMGGGMGGGMEGGMGGGMGGGMPDCHNMMSPTGYDNQISLTVNTVPEPSTALLTGLGLSVLSARRIRRRMA